jgi:tetratricopeptide (TPR) repeat protein
VADSSKKERTEALKQWINDEKGAAKQADRLTYFARLNFYLESLLPDDATTSLIFETVETVPLERIDPEGLGKIASRLVKSYPNVTKDFLERLEDEYPDSRHRTYGYYARAVLDFQKEDYLSARTELARFRAESPMHPLGIPVALLYARSLTASERFKDARETLEEILTMRHAKGRPHAEALIALSQNAAAEGRLERAIPYAQRVYNVYRAYPDLSAKAYWISANQFEAIGDHVAAYKTLDEMLSDPRIRALPIFEEADAKRTLLFEILTERALDEPSPENEVAETTIRTKQLP